MLQLVLRLVAWPGPPCPTLSSIILTSVVCSEGALAPWSEVRLELQQEQVERDRACLVSVNMIYLYLAVGNLAGNGIQSLATGGGKGGKSAEKGAKKAKGGKSGEAKGGKSGEKGKKGKKGRK